MNRSDDESVWQPFIDFWKSRLRYRDLWIGVPLGIAYGIAHAALLLVVQQWFGIRDSSGNVLASYFADPANLGVAVTGGILLVWLYAFLQVNAHGVPDGLTVQAALNPVGFTALMALISGPRHVENYGYPYAAAVVAVLCLNTLWVSFLMRSIRRLA